jgi:hypothetical protein
MRANQARDADDQTFALAGGDARSDGHAPAHAHA